MRPATLAIALLFGCAPRTVPAGPPATAEDVVFTRYSPLSRTEEIARRTLTPLTFHVGQAAQRARGEAFREQQIDLSKETFSLYVPAGGAPKEGFGLLVFVAPWPDPTRPMAWRAPLDRHRTIFVAAANSGNDVSVLDRRVPLALLAYENVRARFPLDPERVYVGGMSGGSRVAEIVALAFPDVFRGALLNAGSDPIGGERGIYLPPADLFRLFQRTRLVYVTGSSDELNLADDEVSRGSMREWCVFDVEVLVARKLAHEPLDRTSMDRALDALDRRSPPDPAALARCNDRVRQELAARVAQARDALARGNRDGARAQLKDLDARYAGLAAPQLLELEGGMQ